MKGNVERKFLILLNCCSLIRMIRVLNLRLTRKFYVKRQNFISRAENFQKRYVGLCRVLFIETFTRSDAGVNLKKKRRRFATVIKADYN